MLQPGVHTNDGRVTTCRLDSETLQFWRVGTQAVIRLEFGFRVMVGGLEFRVLSEGVAV